MSENKVVLVEHYSEHWYKIVIGEEKIFIPSVTTKLSIKDKPFLAKWRGDIGNREADLRLYDSQQKGKRIHWAWETILKGGAAIYDPWQNPIYTEESIKKIKEEHGDRVTILRTFEEMADVYKLQQQFKILKPEVLAVEETVYDLEHKDAGTIDHVYFIKEGVYEGIAGSKPLHLDEGFYIGDLKTGSTVDDNVWMQLAPYLVMYEKMHGVQMTGAIVTHTGAKTKKGIEGLMTMVRSRQVLIEEDYPDYCHASSLWMRDHKDDQPETYEIPSLITLKGETPWPTDSETSK